MQEHLFVYGTLAPNKPNEHILAAITGTWTTGYVQGTLKEAGWGAKLGFAGLILDENGQHILGHLFSSEQLEQIWHSLDAFEGDEYKRVLTDVYLHNGQIQQAFIYVLNGA